MKLKEPSLTALFVILQEAEDWILPAEVIERYGDYKDWRNVVGTGPWILTDYIEGVSKSYIKNPDYWGFDEKYPGNRLPYSDQLRALLMPEEATLSRRYALVRLISYNTPASLTRRRGVRPQLTVSLTEEANTLGGQINRLLILFAGLGIWPHQGVVRSNHTESFLVPQRLKHDAGILLDQERPKVQLVDGDVQFFLKP